MVPFLQGRKLARTHSSQSADLVQAAGRHPRQMDPPPVPSWRRPRMVKDALIAIGIALITFGAYTLLDLLGAVLVGGP